MWGKGKTWIGIGIGRMQGVAWRCGWLVMLCYFGALKVFHGNLEFCMLGEDRVWLVLILCSVVRCSCSKGELSLPVYI